MDGSIYKTVISTDPLCLIALDAVCNWRDEAEGVFQIITRRSAAELALVGLAFGCCIEAVIRLFASIILIPIALCSENGCSLGDLFQSKEFGASIGGAFLSILVVGVSCMVLVSNIFVEKTNQ